jgi:hypothetical protein
MIKKEVDEGLTAETFVDWRVFSAVRPQFPPGATKILD